MVSELVTVLRWGVAAVDDHSENAGVRIRAGNGSGQGIQSESGRQARRAETGCGARCLNGVVERGVDQAVSNRGAGNYGQRQFRGEGEIAVSGPARIAGHEQDIVRSCNSRHARDDALIECQTGREVRGGKTQRISIRSNRVSERRSNNGGRGGGAGDDRRAPSGVDRDRQVGHGHVQVIECSEGEGVVARQKEIAGRGIGEALVIEQGVRSGGDIGHRPPMARRCVGGTGGDGRKLERTGRQRNGSGRSCGGADDRRKSRGIHRAQDLSDQVRLPRIGHVDLKKIISRYGHILVILISAEADENTAVVAVTPALAPSGWLTRSPRAAPGKVAIGQIEMPACNRRALKLVVR